MDFKKSAFWLTCLLVLFTSCVTDSYLLRMSMGHTGCDQSEMQLSEKDMSFSGMAGVASWKIVCKGNTYYCSSTGQTANCKQAAK